MFYSRYIYEVTEIINQHLTAQYVQFPTSRQDMNNIKSDFMNRFGFPGVIGAVDCTHVAILKPTAEEHNFINRKGYHSLNVQIISDANLRILSLNANYPGSSHDSFIWRQSNIYQHMQRRYEEGLRGTWVIGDSGYPLEPFLLTPFLTPVPESPEANFNSHHAQARNCVERCIGLLKMRFRCLSKERVARYPPNFVGQLINTCAVLHNMCLNYNIQLEEFNNFYNDEDNAYILNEQHIHPHNEAQQIRQNIVNRYFG